MTDSHECHADKDERKKQHVVGFLDGAASALAQAGHKLCVLKTLALIEQGEKPLAHIAEDIIVPCYLNMAGHDDLGWGAVREYLLHEAKVAENRLTQLGAGVTGPAVGLLRTGARSLSDSRLASRAPGAGGYEWIKTRDGMNATTTGLIALDSTFLEVSARQEAKAAAKVEKKRKQEELNGKEDVHGKRKIRRGRGGEPRGEELKHDGSESEMDSDLDEDYTDDGGFIVDDDECLEWESDAPSSVDENALYG
jgi:hypothetical protein